jgi:hypothetical protein
VIFCLAYETSDTILQASESQVVCRSVESQCFTVFCNAGTGNGAGDSTGHSRIVTPTAEVLVEAGTASNVAVRHTAQTGQASYSYTRNGYNTASLQTYWQEGLDIIRSDNPEFYGDVQIPPDIAEATPDPDLGRSGVEYVKQLTLLAGCPSPDWSVDDAPSGTYVDNSGRVSGWVPELQDIGSRFRFEITAANVAGSDTEIWYVDVVHRADLDNDGDVDQEDFGHFQVCLAGSGMPYEPGCGNADLDGDQDVDQNDCADFQESMGGPNLPTD